MVKKTATILEQVSEAEGMYLATLGINLYRDVFLKMYSFKNIILLFCPPFFEPPARPIAFIQAMMSTAQPPPLVHDGDEEEVLPWVQ